MSTCSVPLSGTAGIKYGTDGATNDYTMVVTFSAGVAVTGSPEAQVALGCATLAAAGCIKSGDGGSE